MVSTPNILISGRCVVDVNAFDDDADTLDLWKVSNWCSRSASLIFTIRYIAKVKINLETDLDLLNTIEVKGDMQIQGGEGLKPWDEISEVLTDVPRKHLHIIVRRPGECV